MHSVTATPSAPPDQLLNAALLRGLVRSVGMYYADPRQLGRMRRLYSQFLRKGDLAFDIGAHIGNRTLAFWTLGAHVVSVEPVPTTMRFMRLLFGRSSRIELVQAAVSSVPGESNLLVSEREPTVSTVSTEWADRMLRERAGFAATTWDRSVPVRMITLDQLLGRYGEPAFCKIDVEGHDLDVLHGLSRPLAALSFEYVPPALDLAVACVEYLDRVGGYEFNWSFGDSMRLQWRDWIMADALVAHLEQIPPQSNPGDVYARRRTE